MTVVEDDVLVFEPDEVPVFDAVPELEPVFFAVLAVELEPDAEALLESVD